MFPPCCFAPGRPRARYAMKDSRMIPCGEQKSLMEMPCGQSPARTLFVCFVLPSLRCPSAPTLGRQIVPDHYHGLLLLSPATRGTNQLRHVPTATEDRYLGPTPRYTSQITTDATPYERRKSHTNVFRCTAPSRAVREPHPWRGFVRRFVFLPTALENQRA